MHILRLVRMRSAVRICPAAPKNTRFHHETGCFYVKNLSVLYLLYFRFSLHEKGQRCRSPGAASVLPDILQNTRDETRRTVPCVKNYRPRSLGRMPTCARFFRPPATDQTILAPVENRRSPVGSNRRARAHVGMRPYRCNVDCRALPEHRTPKPPIAASYSNGRLRPMGFKVVKRFCVLFYTNT